MARTVPTCPEMVPRPIEPACGTATVEYIGLKSCVKGESVTVVTPFSTPVAHTLVGEGGGYVVVVADEVVWAEPRRC